MDVSHAISTTHPGVSQNTTPHSKHYFQKWRTKVRSASSKFELTYKWDIDKGILEYQEHDEENSTRHNDEEDDDVPPSKRMRRTQAVGEDIKF